jgi:hypothetical protein
MTCTPHQISFEWLSQQDWGGRGMWHACGAYKVLVGKTEVKRPLGRPRRRWHDNIKNGS